MGKRVHRLVGFVATKIALQTKDNGANLSVTNNEFKGGKRIGAKKVALLLITLACCLFLSLFLWKDLGKQTVTKGLKATPWPNDPLNDPTYKAREEFIISMIALNGSRPYTRKEMKLLRELAQMKEGDCLWRDHRGDAIYLLSLSPDPRQREEALHFSIDGLKDPCWYIRLLSVKALGRLKPKETVTLLLSLINDPHPEVRKQVKKVVQQLGYKVGE